MAEINQVLANNMEASLIEELGKAVLQLEAYKNASEDRTQWAEIKEHFCCLEDTLKKEFEEFEAREKEFKCKEAETLKLIADREAAAAAKEQELLDRVQELKDAAVAVIAEARAVHQPTASDAIDGHNSDNKLTEKFPLVPLLKTYLKDLRRNSQGKSEKNMGGGAGTPDDVNAKELAALKSVIRCVEEYQLEADYPLDPLQRRVAQLEKSMADKKRSGESAKRQQPKKKKVNGRFQGHRALGPMSTPTPVRAPVYAERVAYTGMPERYAPAATHAYDYQVSRQSAYVQQANDQRLYYYHQDDRMAPNSYNAAPPSYGSYVGSGLQPSNQQYM